MHTLRPPGAIPTAIDPVLLERASARGAIPDGRNKYDQRWRPGRWPALLLNGLMGVGMALPPILMVRSAPAGASKEG